MRRLIIAAIAVLLALPAAADMYQDARNAELPAALYNLGLQTPAACDGKIGPDGAITGGSAAFTAGSAGFGVADVGKRIAIAGAGAAQHLNTATLIGGGAGHTAGQIIPITGGTGTAGSIEVRAVSGGVATEIGQANLGAYTAPPANPVSAGDITFTATWLRDAHVTTIQAVNSATGVTLAANVGNTVSGATWGYGSDYSGEINAALAANSRATLPKGICGVASSIQLGNAHSLRGQTHRQTALMWLGPSRGGSVVATSAAGMQIWYGGRLADLAVDGLGSADTCIDLHGINGWRIEEILAERCVANLMALELSVTGSVIENIFYGVTLNAAINGITDSAMPLRFGNRNPTANPSGASNIGYNRFYDLRLLYANQTALQCGYADNNHFYGVWAWQSPGGTAKWAFDFQGDSDPASCQYNSFYGLTVAPQNAAGSIVARSGAVTPSVSTVIYGYSKAAGIPNPTVEPGARLLCKGIAGDDNLCTPRAFGNFFGGTKSVTDTAAYRMFGAGATFTPRYSGRMGLTIAGAMTSSVAGSGGTVVASYGTGAAPANGAALAGTQCGAFQALTNTPSTTFTVPFSVTCNVAGFTSETPYWFDLAGKALVGGTFSIQNVSLTWDEAP